MGGENSSVVFFILEVEWVNEPPAFSRLEKLLVLPQPSSPKPSCTLNPPSPNP